MSLHCQDKKMAGFLLNKKMDTWLKSVFRDLHIDATTGAILKRGQVNFFSHKCQGDQRHLTSCQFNNMDTSLESPLLHLYSSPSKTRTHQIWSSQFFSLSTVIGPFLWPLSHSKQHGYIIGIPFLLFMHLPKILQKNAHFDQVLLETTNRWQLCSPLIHRDWSNLLNLPNAYVPAWNLYMRERLRCGFQWHCVYDVITCASGNTTVNHNITRNTIDVLHRNRSAESHTFVTAVVEKTRWTTTHETFIISFVQTVCVCRIRSRVHATIMVTPALLTVVRRFHGTSFLLLPRPLLPVS